MKKNGVIDKAVFAIMLRKFGEKAKSAITFGSWDDEIV